MTHGIPLPSVDVLLCADFKKFHKLSKEYFASINVASVVESLTLADLQSASLHPAGFLVIYIMNPKERENGQLRLHIWPSTINPSQSDAHYHTWHLASKVMLGSYRESRPIIEITDNTDAQYGAYRISHSSGPHDKFSVVVDRHANVYDQPVKIYRAHDIHYLSAGSYHLTKPKGFFVTLNLMSKPLLDYAEFIRRIDSKVQPKEQSRELTMPVDEIFEQLNRARVPELR